MKLLRSTKKLLGIICLSVFSFALSIALTKYESQSVYAEGSQYQSLDWVWDSEYEYFYASYSDNVNDGIMSATIDSGTYDGSSEELSLICTIQGAIEGNVPSDAMGSQINLIYDIYSSDLESDPDKYSFSGKLKGSNNVSPETLIIDRVIIEVLSNQVDESYWVERDGSVYFHNNDGSEFAYEVTNVEYFINYDYAVLTVVSNQYGDTQYITVGEAEFSPDAEEGTYNGTLNCYLSNNSPSASITIDCYLEIDYSHEPGQWIYSRSHKKCIC